MSDDQELKKQQFQEFIDSTPIGTKVIRTISYIQAFGIFVDLDNISFHGLIEIVLSTYHPGKQLPHNQQEWPQIGKRINCCINYFREHNFEIGLGWLPDIDK